MRLGCWTWVAALIVLMVAACNQTAAPTGTPVPTATPTLAPTATPSPTPAPTPSPSPTPMITLPPPPSPTPTASPAVGLPGPTCINGWTSPAEGDPKRTEGLDILTNYMGLTDPLLVDDMRYFVGPDPDSIIAPRFEEVEHWYIKATLSTDPTYRGRWLIERRDEMRLGVSAVAPYDTTGYESPDWHGFEGDGLPRAIEGLPGLWGGIDYDFVTGEGDGGFPGLADSQSGCMVGI